MDTQDKNKRETAANTMRYELVQQTWFPSWGMPALGWFRNTPDPMIPSPHPKEDEEEPEPNWLRGGPKSKQKQKVPPMNVIRGTTADGEEYKIWVMAKEHVKGFAMGAARFGANATLAVGRNLVDF